MEVRTALSGYEEAGSSVGAPPPGFLARIASAVGSRPRAAAAQPGAAFDLSAARSARHWIDALTIAGRGLGFRTRTAELSIREVAESRLLHVSWCPTAGWVAVTGLGNGWLRLIRPREQDSKVTQLDLTKLLDLGDDETRRQWCFAEPSLSAATSLDGRALPPLRRLVELLRPDKGDLVTIVLYAVFIGLLTLATPIAVQQLVNSVAFGGLVQPVVVLALFLFAGLAFAGLLTAVQTYLAEIIQRRVFVRACIDLADRLPRVHIDAFGSRHGPEVVNRFFDLVTLQKVGASLLLGGTSLVLQTFAGLIILSFYHPVMFGFSLLLIGSIALVVFLGRGATQSAIAESSAKYDLGAWMEELARHPSSFRTRSGRRHAMARADELAAAWVEARRQHFRIVMRQIVASLGLQVGVGTLVLALGGMLVVAGQLTLGQLVASEIIVTAVVAAFARLGKMLESFYDLLAAVDKVGVLLDLPLERDGGDSAPGGNAPARLEAQGLELVGEGEAVHRDLTLTIASGERVGLVGADRSGKRRLLDQLCGLETPLRGSVRLDGHDLTDLRLESIGEQAMLLREPEILAGTLADNVRIARPEATLGEVREALRRVGLEEVAQRLPDALHAKLSPDGSPLTGDQARLLMLARAFVARPRLLLLDEALLQLDDSARKRALEAVFDANAPWSLLVVSRNADVLAHCDRVVSIADLCLAEQTGGEAAFDAAVESNR